MHMYCAFRHRPLLGVLVLVLVTLGVAQGEDCLENQIVLPHGSSYEIGVSGSTVVINNGTFVTTIDVTDPHEPERLTSLDLGKWVSDINTHLDHVLVTAGDMISVIDLSEPSLPHQVASLECRGARDIVVSQDLMYVAGSELCIVDVADPNDPQILSTTRGRFSHAATYGGGILYLATSTSVKAVDVSNPQAPREVWELEMDLEYESIHDVAVSGQWVYVVGSAGLYIIDAANSPNPVLVNHDPRPTSGNGVLVHDDRMYVLALGVWVYDLSPPSIPNLVGVVDIEADHLPSSMAIGQNLGFLAAGSSHLRILDLEAGNLPVVIGLHQPLRMTEAAIVSPDLMVQAADRFASGPAIYGMRQFGAEFRSNLSLTNVSGHPASVNITLLNSRGDSLSSFVVNVDPREVRQLSQPFVHQADSPDIGWGFAVIEVVDGGGIFASASVIDNRTNDATTVPMERLE